MSKYMTEKWKYSERSGFKTPVNRLARDPNTNSYMDCDEIDAPRFVTRSIGPDKQVVLPTTAGDGDGIDVAVASVNFEVLNNMLPVIFPKTGGFSTTAGQYIVDPDFQAIYTYTD